MDFSNVKQIISSSLGEITKITNFEGITLWQKISRILKEWRGSSPLTCAGTVANPFEEVKVYGNSVQSGLPTEYTPLEYIEATGTQYIQLKYGFMNTDEIDFTFSEVYAGQTSDKYMVAPSAWNDNYNRFGMGRHLYVTEQKICYIAAYGSDSTGTCALLPSTLYDNELPHTWHYKNYVFSIDEPKISKDFSNTYFKTETTNLRLFYGYNSPTKGKIYYWRHKKIVNGVSTLVECLIPAKRNSDNVVGMYDLVSKTFFTNEGTGTFVAGDVVSLPTPEIPIEIKSVGDKTKNLLPRVVDGTYTLNGVTAVAKNGVITFSGTATTTTTIACPLAEEYTIPTSKGKGGTAVFYAGNNLNPGTSPVFYFGYNSTKIDTWSFTTAWRIIDTYSGMVGKVINKIGLEINSGINVNGLTLSPMFVDNDSTLTQSDFDPYGYKVPVDVRGKNLFDKNSENVLLNQRIYQGVPGANNGTFISDYIEVIAGETYISYKYNLFDKTGIWINFFDENKNYVSVLSASAQYDTFTIPSNVKYLRFNGVMDKIDVIKFQKGYITNLYPSEPLRKVGSYADTVSIKGPDVTVVRNVEVLDDTGTKTIEESYQGKTVPTTETFTIDNTINALDTTSIVNIDTETAPSEVYCSEYIGE